MCWSPGEEEQKNLKLGCLPLICDCEWELWGAAIAAPVPMGKQLLQQDWDTTIIFCTRKLAGLGDTRSIFIQVLNFYARSCITSHCTEGPTKTVVLMTSTIIMPTRQSLVWAVLLELVAQLPCTVLQGVMAAKVALPLDETARKGLMALWSALTWNSMHGTF